MKIAVLIQAHRNPEQLARLCKQLQHQCVDIYIHIDLKSDIRPFKELIPQATYIDDRVNVIWGGFSQVEATLRSLRRIHTAPTKYDYVLLTSGQDCLLKPIDYIVEQIEIDMHRGKGYIFGRPLTDSKVDFYTHRSYKNYHVSLTNMLLAKIINKVIRLFSFVKRKYPYNTIVKGSSWWCLTSACTSYILDFCNANPQYVKFHKYARCCDEYFFHNIVANSPFANAELRIEDHHYVYTDWSEHKPNPKIFTINDYQAIITSGKWLARKFDTNTDTAIIDAIQSTH